MKTYRRTFITYLVLTVAGIINAFGITFFLYPVHLYDSGISGLSMLLAQITPKALTLSFFLMVLNLPLYSILTYAAAVKTVDFIAEGLDKSKSAMIITNKPDKICEALSKEFGNGTTILSAKGYYSDEEKKMIYFVVNRFQISKVRNIVKMYDTMAYVTIIDVADVL